MKLLLTFLLLTISISSFAQKYSDSTLTAALAKQTDTQRLDKIQINLYRFSRTYNTGTAFIGFGIAIGGVGTAAALNGNTQDYNLVAGALVAGGILTSVGWIITVGAHKFIRKASGFK